MPTKALQLDLLGKNIQFKKKKKLNQKCSTILNKSAEQLDVNTDMCKTTDTGTEQPTPPMLEGLTDQKREKKVFSEDILPHNSPMGATREGAKEAAERV